MCLCLKLSAAHPKSVKEINVFIDPTSNIGRDFGVDKTCKQTRPPL